MNNNLEIMKMMVELTKLGYTKEEVLAACGVTTTAPQVVAAEAVDVPTLPAKQEAPKKMMTAEQFLATEGSGYTKRPYSRNGGHRYATDPSYRFEFLEGVRVKNPNGSEDQYPYGVRIVLLGADDEAWEYNKHKILSTYKDVSYSKSRPRLNNGEGQKACYVGPIATLKKIVADYKPAVRLTKEQKVEWFDYQKSLL